MTIQILGKKNLFMIPLSLIGLLSMIHRFDDHFDYLYEKTSQCIDTHVPKKKVTKKIPET